MDAPPSARPRAFPKSERVRQRAVYLAVQGRGRKWQSASFLCFMASSPVGARRLGVTVTKRVGGAVVRNRVKRLVREVYRQNKAVFPLAADVVFVAKQRAAGLGFYEVKREIEELCARSAARK